MRKEIFGICFLFVVTFLLLSILSHHPADPSINNVVAQTSQIHNLFGVIGAYVSGILVGLFGVGAFWIPALLFFFTIWVWRRRSIETIVPTAVGGLLLMVSTGSLISLQRFPENHLAIFGSRFSTGGILGITFHEILVKYANITGAAIILLVIWVIGFMLATGFSMFAFSAISRKVILFVLDRVKKRWVFLKNRPKKKQKTAKIKKHRGKTNLTIFKPPSKQKKLPFKIDFPVQPRQGQNSFQLPTFDFLKDQEVRPISVNRKNLGRKSKLLEDKLNDFGVEGKVEAVRPGPVITTFEYKPAPGVKINKIVNLTNDLALALRAMSIRIIAPIPGKAVIGIEIPNADRQIVRLKEVIESPAFAQSKSNLTISLGKDVVGKATVAELEKMPHLLIAGATGTGKSVGLNAMICSLLYKSAPEDVKLLMVDPKRIELSIYDGIPHLITPVVTDVKKATNALFWAVREMERRYELLSEQKTRNLRQYNRKVAKMAPAEKLPLIVIVIDELADLMMVASRDVELALTRLAQMARAAGIHLILATQRPSVDVLTGIIKANFPTRLTFQVSSRTDSRTILDANGAELLLGNGDMLFLPPGTARLQRIHGAYISEEEIFGITNFLKSQKEPEYNSAITESPSADKSVSGQQEHDERYDDAVALVTRTRQASISMIQRHLRIGYNRAARIVEMMEQEGIVGPSDGVKARKVLVQGYEGMA